MKGKALAFSLMMLLLAGCAAPGADVDPSVADAPAPLEPLTEDVYGMGAFLAADVPSYDGVPIHVDVQMPDAEGPFPTLVAFTPYSSTLNPQQELWGIQRSAGQDAAFGLADRYVPKGYAVAIAHVRGSGQSGGCFDVGGPNDGLDGNAIVEWIAAQAWSTGKVAMMGTSYVGTTPLATAVTNPPHLTTIVPVSAVSEWYKYYFENGEPRFFGELPTGVTYLDHPLWAATGQVPKPRNPTAMDPLANAECGAAQMENAWAQDDYNDYWMARNYVKDMANATAPMLYAHGFLDENTPTSLVPGLFAAYPAEKRMWLQQHGHGVPSEFEAYYEYEQRWLDYWMLGKENGALRMAPVVVQDNRGDYHVVPDWPPRNATLTVFHLAEGALLPEPPADATLSYTDDPRAMDEVPVEEAREGAFLQFDSAPLERDTLISGAPRVELIASSDKTDTQFDVLLYDVAPDGSSTLITRGYLDARHADDPAKGKDLVPGEERLFAWDLHPRDHVVEAGHVLRLVLASEEEYVLPDAPGATNTVRVGPAGSRLVVPVLDMQALAFGDAPVVR